MFFLRLKDCKAEKKVKGEETNFLKVVVKRDKCLKSQSLKS